MKKIRVLITCFFLDPCYQSGYPLPLRSLGLTISWRVELPIMFNRFKNFIKKYFDLHDHRSCFSDEEILKSIESAYAYIYDNYGYSNLDLEILIAPVRYNQIKRYLIDGKFQGLVIKQHQGLKRNDIVFLPIEERKDNEQEIFNN